MNELSLFSGAGGGVLGTKLLGWRTVGYVEWEPYCQKIIEQRIKDGFLDEAPIFGDIDHFIKSGASKKYAGFVDVVTAGFPCQPFSVAGKGRGEKDERNKWPQTIQTIRDVRPRFALLENVPGLLNSGYFHEILGSLAESGFDAKWVVLGADDVGAPHRRKRLWILAYPHGQRLEEHGHGKSAHAFSASEVADPHSERQLQPEGSEQEKRGRSGDSSEDVQDPERSGRLHREHEEGRIQVREQRESGAGSGERVSGDSPAVADSDSNDGRTGSGTVAQGWESRLEPWSRRQRQSVERSSEDVADSDSPGLSKRWRPESMETEHSPSECGSQGQSTSYWSTEPNVGRVANGVASRVDRLKALGNGQVPAVAATAWTILSTGT